MNKCIKSIAHLKTLLMTGRKEFNLQIEGSQVKENIKSISWNRKDRKFHIIHHLAREIQDLTEAEILSTYHSQIGVGINKGHLTLIENETNN